MLEPAEAELYLRLLAERVLLDGEPQHLAGGSVPSAAAALVAVGAIKTELAEDIVRDFDLACMLRGRGGSGMAFRARMQAPPSASPGKAPKPPRVVPCRAKLDLSWGTVKVRYVMLSDELTTIGITGSETATGSFARPGQPPQVQLSDDQGTTVTARFSGSLGPALDGVLTCDPPLSRRTRWIDFSVGRIDLPETDQVAPEVRLEQLPQTDPALAHLWRQLATTRGPIPASNDLGAAIEALVAVGAVDGGSAELDQLRTVAETVGTGWHSMGLRGQPAHSQVPLPEPWHSLAATRRKASGQGPVGVLAVGAVTPPVDGTVVVVEALVSNREGFMLNVTTTPGTSVFGPILNSPGDPLAWWAEDDRGGVYLGGPGSWGGRPGHSRGTIQFWPALDPHCRELRILPTGQTQRAVIPITLCWDEAT